MISCESESHIQPVDKDCSSSQLETISSNQIIANVSILQQNSVHENTPSTEIDKISQNATDQMLQELLIPISKLIQAGKSPQIATNKPLHYRLMNFYYYKLYKSLNDQHNNQNYLIFVLSLLAQIVRQHKKIKLPFTRKIVLALLTFDLESFDQSQEGQKLLTILAVLLGNLAKQIKLVIKLKVEHQLKEGILQLLSKTDHIFALQILIKSLNLLQSSANIIVSDHDLQAIEIMKRVYQNWGAKGWYAVRLSICHKKKHENVIVQERKTLLELISK